MEMCVASPTDLPTLARLARGRKYCGAMGVRNSSATEAEYTREVAKRNLCSGSTLTVWSCYLLFTCSSKECCETPTHRGGIYQRLCKAEPLQWQYIQCPVSGPVTCSLQSPWAVADSVAKLPHGTEANHTSESTLQWHSDEFCKRFCRYGSCDSEKGSTLSSTMTPWRTLVLAEPITASKGLIAKHEP